MSWTNATPTRTAPRIQIGRAQTPAEQFIADPVGFMEHNYVDTGPGDQRCVANIPLSFTFIKQTGHAKLRSDPSVLGDKYGLAFTTKTGPEVFSAYWCPYEDSKFLTCNISSGANFIFTATMNGCTFATGSVASDGSLTVMHGNAKGQTNTRRKQNAIMYGAGFDRNTVNPAVYMNLVHGANSEAHVTTFGVRDAANTWRFYYQLASVTIGGGTHSAVTTYEILGVIPT